VNVRFVGSVALIFVATATRFARAQQPKQTAEAPNSVPADAPETVTVRGSQAGGFENRITEGQGIRPATDAASLFEGQPGLHVRRQGADGSFSTLMVRGASSNQLNVYIAGIPITGGADPALNLSSLPLWSGAQYQVYRTFAPAWLGQGSLGGTLTIEPPANYNRDLTETGGAIGSFGAARAGGCISSDETAPMSDKSIGRTLTCFSLSRSDGDFDYLDPLASSPGKPAFVDRRNARTIDAATIAQRSIRFNILGVQGRYVVTGLSLIRDQQLPGTVRAPTPVQSIRSSRGAGALELDANLGSGTAIARWWFRRDRTRLRDSAFGSRTTVGPTSTDDTDISMGLTGQYRTPLWLGANMRWTLDAQGERFIPGSWKGAPQAGSASRASFGTGLDFEQRIGAITLSAVNRLDRWQDASGDENVNRSAAVEPSFHIGADYKNSWFGLSAHVGRTVRPPTFLELFGNRGAFIGNSSLKAEEAVAGDLGMQLRAGKGVRVFESDFSGFWQRARNVIVTVPQGAFGRARAENLGLSRNLGLEAAVRARFDVLQVRASYTWIDARNLDACEISGLSCERPALPGRPQHDLSLDLSYFWGHFQARYGLDYVAGIRADLAGAIQVPARVLQSVGFRYDFPAPYRITLTFDIRNIADVREGLYDGLAGPVSAPIGDAFDYPLPGRSFLMTLRFTRDWALNLGDPSQGPRRLFEMLNPFSSSTKPAPPAAPTSPSAP
jgi:TonB-dependent Receptor Plug Domain